MLVNHFQVAASFYLTKTDCAFVLKGTYYYLDLKKTFIEGSLGCLSCIPGPNFDK